MEAACGLGTRKLLPCTRGGHKPATQEGDSECSRSRQGRLKTGAWDKGRAERRHTLQRLCSPGRQFVLLCAGHCGQQFILDASRHP